MVEQRQQCWALVSVFLNSRDLHESDPYPPDRLSKAASDSCAQNGMTGLCRLFGLGYSNLGECLPRPPIPDKTLENCNLEVGRL